MAGPLKPLIRSRPRTSSRQNAFRVGKRIAVCRMARVRRALRALVHAATSAGAPNLIIPSAVKVAEAPCGTLAYTPALSRRRREAGQSPAVEDSRAAPDPPQ